MFESIRALRNKKQILKNEFTILLAINIGEVINDRTKDSLIEQSQIEKTIKFIEIIPTLRIEIVDSFYKLLNTIKPGHIDGKEEDELLEIGNKLFEEIKTFAANLGKQLQGDTKYNIKIQDTININEKIFKLRLTNIITLYNFDRVNWFSRKRDEILFTVLGIVITLSIIPLSKIMDKFSEFIVKLLTW
jgi:hypothetical protein